jgi:tetraacyldisaccharide-1-P 4'-kinase
VTPSDDVTRTGDEAIECARALEGENVTVLVARSRQTAIDAAHDFADVIVLDGPLQLAPRRATLALLAVDPTEPWGSGACPPLGNLRARKNALISAADLVVPVAPTSRGVWKNGELIHMSELRRMRVGLTTGIARPDRVVAMMAAHGIRLDPILYAADHSKAPEPRSPDLWVTTSKDAARGSDFAVIDYHLVVPSAVEAALRSRFFVHF